MRRETIRAGALPVKGGQSALNLLDQRRLRESPVRRARGQGRAVQAFFTPKSGMV